MNPGRASCGIGAALAVLACLAQAETALARGADPVPGARAPEESLTIVPAVPTTPPVVLAMQSLDVKPRAGATAGGTGAKSTAGATGRGPSRKPADGRGASPVHTATAAGPEQPGYVHYFLLRLPDESLEIQVGIEVPGKKIAWSFPDLGVVVSPFVEEGVVPAGGRKFEIWHLYGIRPFPDDAAMGALRSELADRVGRWTAAGIPYCEGDGPRSACMSCLGFVLRVLFPGRHSDFPELPRDFWRTGYVGRYSTQDLLLYLTGMLDLPSREARLRRINQLALPDALREDVMELVHAMGATEAAPTANAGAAQKRPATRPSAISIRPAQRKPL